MASHGAIGKLRSGELVDALVLEGDAGDALGHRAAVEGFLLACMRFLNEFDMCLLCV